MKKKTELPLPIDVYARTNGVVKHEFSNQDNDEWVAGVYVYLKPTLWIVQNGRKRASFTNPTAAKTFAGKSGKIRAFVEVQA